MTPEYFAYALVFVLCLGVITLLGTNGYYSRFSQRPKLAMAPPEPEFVSFWSGRYGRRLARVLGPAPSGSLRLTVIGHPPGVTLRRKVSRLKYL